MAINLFDLTGKVALVTGGNSGLGLGFATGLAKAGADVVIWGRRADRNEAACALLRPYGGRVMAQPVDVSDEHQVATGMEALLAEMGRLDCVVANAGIASRARFADMPTDLYQQLLAINLHGAVYTLREAARHMTARAEAGDPGGSMIICGSGAIFQGVPTLAHYGIAKGGLNALAKALAAELGPHKIRCNVVAPGFIVTELGGEDPDVAARFMAGVVKRIPLERAGTPRDLEGIIVYLASDASSYHSGDTIIIDGGKFANNPSSLDLA